MNYREESALKGMALLAGGLAMELHMRDEVESINEGAGAERQMRIIGDWILENASDRIGFEGLADVVIPILDEWLESKNDEKPEIETATVLNPGEEMNEKLSELAKKNYELYSIIAPLQDIPFDWLNKWGRNFGLDRELEMRCVGEVLDRANEFFHGR